MASNSTTSNAFDFASDDILSSYDDFPDQNTSIPTKDFQKSRISRSSALPTTNVYNQPEESLNQELLLTVDRTMKKYADNLMRFLEGISSRLSQLELYCYNLDKSIGEMRSDLVRDHGDADSKLKFLEKHLQEVHRSIQILRDKQELAETQKELTKLQLAQDTSSTVRNERAVSSSPERKKTDDVSDSPNTQLALALALPSQIAAQPAHPYMQQPSSASQAVGQLPAYYLPSYPPPEAQYRAPQMAPIAPQPSQAQQYPQYQQWPQQASQLIPPPQQPPMMPPQQLPNQMRAPAPAPAPQTEAYPSYMTNQPANPPGIQRPGASRPEASPYGYSSTPRPSPPEMKGSFPSQQGDGYDTISSGGTYMLYNSDGRQLHLGPQPSHYPQGGYPPSNPSLPNTPPQNSNSLMIRNPAPQQYVRSHPYNEVIDKLVSMGYRSDHVVSVIQWLEENGQAVDFNAVLDKLNGHSSGSSQRSW